MGFSQKTINTKAPAWLLMMALLLIVFLLFPVVVILLRGFLSLGSISSSAVLEALRVSAWTTATTVVITIFFGTPVAYLLARFEFFGKQVLDAALDLPLVLPPVVAGLGLLLTFGRNGFLGSGLEMAGVQLAFSPCGGGHGTTFCGSPVLYSHGSGWLNATRFRF